MRRRITTIAVTVATAAAMLLGTASTASAVGSGYTIRGHYGSQAACQAAGAAGAANALWSPLFICKPFAAKPSVYELWVRY
ncbi:hypothetical protein [Streptomyces anulatus]|uniref:hypothetical protein n=1 Tax=Streptomyces anulatus TaxID=1892 RepID=UPI00255C6D40|nr:hypothetical protein [Streptomyces anulatus]WIY79066.1 hypothetical protein QPM16_27745 [Streptomyces anulatus]